MDWGRKWLVDFNVEKTQLVLSDWSKNAGAYDVKMDGTVLEEKSTFQTLGWPSVLNWTGALTLSLLLKLPPRKLEPWFVLWTFLLLRLLCISINLSHSQVWNTVVISGLMLLVAPYNFWIRYKNGYARLLVLHLLPLSLSLFYRYYFSRYSSKLAQLVPLSYSGGRSTRYSDTLCDFFVTIPRCYKDVYVNSSFPLRARLWNSLSIECFSLTYDLSGFKYRINRHLLTLGSF